MNEYNFSTLNDKDFEILVKDLLNAELDLQLQHFKSGKDQGIDLRFSTSGNSNSVVVQVKHYLASGYSQLKSTLKTKELDKIKKLEPQRYIIATSIPLSAVQKDEIRKLLSPYILTSNDIFGQEDLNGFILKHPQIEKNHFKLWFSSTTVINAILNNAIEGRTKYLIEKIKNHVKFYVVTEKLDEANNILLNEKLLLITGQPGIGKTTLAELLIFEKAYENYQVYQVENISEAETMISLDDKQLQLFYFDDFLGANYYEIVNAHKTETQLTRFVERIISTPNKYIVLTTRTVILNQAVEKYEKIGRSSLSSNQFELKLNDYNSYEKALILYNHIFFRGLKSELHEKILENRFYTKIISHRNYTPRIIEFITDANQTKHLKVENYQEFILLNLNNPKEIWRSSFNNQISYLDKCLLMTLFTFEKSVLEHTLSEAFEERLQFEKNQHNQIINTNQFHDSIKTLLNGFITSNLHSKNELIREYLFINPSLTDFLLAYVSESELELRAIASSIKYVEQLNRFSPAKALITLDSNAEMLIRDRIDNGKIQILESKSKYFTDNNKHSIYSEVLCKYCPSVNKDKILLQHFSSITFDESWYSIIERISFVLYNLGDSPQTIQYIKDNFLKIAEKFILSIDNLDMIGEIPDIFKLYNQNYIDYTESEEGMENLLHVVNVILSNTEESIKDQYKSQVTRLDDVPDYYDEIESVKKDLNVVLFPNTYMDFDFDYEIDEEFWIEHIHDNLRSDDYNYDREYKHRPSSEEISGFMTEKDMIDDLFSGE